MFTVCIRGVIYDGDDGDNDDSDNIIHVNKIAIQILSDGLHTHTHCMRLHRLKIELKCL